MHCTGFSLFPRPARQRQTTVGQCRCNPFLLWVPMIQLPLILDPCCGSRSYWFNRNDPRAVFGDVRHETVVVKDQSHKEGGTRTLHIEPDVLLDFRKLPYADGTFKLVSFDPPHLVRTGPRSWLAAKYGKLRKEWREDIRSGFSECFRVLAPDGVLIFKWNETQIPLGDVLALTDQQPLFGHPSGKRGKTHWVVFMKGAA